MSSTYEMWQDEIKEEARLNKLKKRTEDLTDSLTTFVQCIETIKYDRQHDGTNPDWFDWAFINQELKKAKKILGDVE